MNNSGVPFVRIGVFFDGSFFTHVSDHYLYHHPRHSRLSIDGFHDFVRESLATAEGVPIERCRVVEAHYFRGRMSARDAADRDRLLAERQWDETLLRFGVTPYYLPLTTNGQDRFEEKGVDVWYALEAYERARDGRFDVAVLVAGDGDYVPLVRKLQRIGVRVMVVGCNIEVGRTTRTSRRLLAESTYPLLLNEVVDDPQRADDPRVLRLFVLRRDQAALADQVVVRAEREVLPVAPLTNAPDDVPSAADISVDMQSPVDARGDTPDDSPGDMPGDMTGVLQSAADVPVYAPSAADDVADDMRQPADIPADMPSGDRDDDDDGAATMRPPRRMHGIISRLKEGFGFARVDGLPRDVFFHQSALADRSFLQLREGEAATLLVSETERGYVASQVLCHNPPPANGAVYAAPALSRPTPARPPAAIAPLTPAFPDDEGYPL